MLTMMGLAVLFFFMRALYFAPFGEMGLPQRFSGSVLSVAAFLVYLPASFAYLLWGWLLDTYPGEEGYIYMFSSLAAVTGIGIFIAHHLKKRIASGSASRIAARIEILDQKLDLHGKEKTLF